MEHFIIDSLKTKKMPVFRLRVDRNHQCKIIAGNEYIYSTSLPGNLKTLVGCRRYRLGISKSVGFASSN
jgi:hypothetical protein